jgi:hypothetical protein
MPHTPSGPSLRSVITPPPRRRTSHENAFGWILLGIILAAAPALAIIGALDQPRRPAARVVAPSGCWSTTMEPMPRGSLDPAGPSVAGGILAPGTTLSPTGLWVGPTTTSRPQMNVDWPNVDRCELFREVSRRLHQRYDQPSVHICGSSFCTDAMKWIDDHVIGECGSSDAGASSRTCQPGRAPSIPIYSGPPILNVSAPW